MYSISEDKIDLFFEAAAKTRDVFIPVENSSGKSNFEKYEKGIKLSQCLKTVRSAKDFFFPKAENLVNYIKEGKSFKVEDPRKDVKDFVVFGVRACDAASFNIIDSVYLNQTPVDTYYKNRRDHGTVITLACNNPERTCFCSAYGLDPSLSTSVNAGDVFAWNCDGKYFFDAKTEKGKKLLESVKEVFENSTEEKIKDLQKEITDKIAQVPFAALDLEKIKKLPMLDMFNAKAWDKISEPCLGCGTCTYVCPTCMCFDVRDFDSGKKIEQVRCYDSCMYSDFTQMAAENPRHTQKERSRQRFMHKLKYYPMAKENVFACVGCGRCLESCPVNMNIVKVIKMLNEEF